MLETTPHILNTTPETLSILLNSPKFKEKLRTVEYVIVDEIHSLAENKRGTHLSVSLERLEELCRRSTDSNRLFGDRRTARTVAEFLVGCEEPGGDPRDYELVDTRFARDFDLELSCPTDDLINTPRNVVTSGSTPSCTTTSSRTRTRSCSRTRAREQNASCTTSAKSSVITTSPTPAVTTGALEGAHDATSKRR